MAAMLSLGASHAQTNRIILHETFESYKTTKALRSVWHGGQAELVTNGPGGGQCVSHDGRGMHRREGFFVFPDATHNLILQADLYDFGTNTDQYVTVSIIGENGPDNISMGMKGASCYALRVSGFSSRTNWIPFKRGQLPVVGWHRFRAIISTTNLVATLDLGIDGKVDRKVTIPFDRPVPTFTQLRFGGYSHKPPGNQTVLVGDIQLELVSLEPPTVAASAPVPEPVTNSTLITSNSTGAVSRDNSETSNSVQSVEAPLPAMRSAATSTQLNASSPPIQTSAIAPPSSSSQTNTAIWWAGGALAVIIGLLGVVIMMLRRQSASVPKALITDGSDVGQSSDGSLVSASGNGQWRERALQAEAVAAKQAQILKDKVGPELAKFAKETLVQGLYAQRNVLVETQAKARQMLIELETRLSDLQLPARERIKAYEKRIAELEKQLESRDDEMLELTRATLLLVRERLEQERQQGPRFN